jgi:hypothetical protein
MVENELDDSPGIWKKFLRKHWRMAVLFVVGAVLAAIGAVLVYLWFVGQAQSSGLVPTTLNLWTMGHLIAFILNLIFWELVLIGIPVVLAVIGAYLVWNRLPAHEREEYRRGGLFRSRSRRRDYGNGFSFLVNIAFIIKIYADGNWNSPFATWTFDYLVYSFIVALISIAIIFGIPALIAGAWWLRREMRS